MSYYFILGSLVFFYMSLWFVISLVIKRNDIADIAWGLGFALLAWMSLLLSGETGVRSLLVNSLVSIWGLRLAIHIFRRNRKKKEDYRYENWRREWGKWFVLRSYLQVYLLQGVFLFLIALPFLFVNNRPSVSLGLMDYFGLTVFLTGFFFEAVGDRQLRDFVSDPENKGKIMNRGLWRYSRHPNYFGEVVLWWGIYLMAVSAGGILTVIGPLTITILILFVSGIPLLEKKYAGRPDFEKYKKETSIFFPLPPKHI